MSLPLKDFRTAIPESTDLWLEIEAQATGKDKAAIAREVLGGWAKSRLHAHTVAARRLAANGLTPDVLGSDPDDDGAARNAGTSRSGRRQ